MSEIKLLSEELINQIAAGEVVERPSSVVKELVENSIDAGAKNIVIEIENGGKNLIKVSDDGKGISEDDLEMALQRHATSKISSEKDLWNIHSFGFRGEALASISSVSQMTIRSKRETDLSGKELNSDGGIIINKKDAGIPNGTQVIVKSLFFNTPARQKFLKQEDTEFGNISSTVNFIALSYPDISFKLLHNGKTAMNLSKVSDLNTRIGDIFGSAVKDALIPVYYNSSQFKISGFICKPVISRSSSKYQHFFVNKRFVRQNLLANTIKQAFHSMLMENKQAVFFVSIDIEPALIDVNVHPRKLEIRFLNQADIIKALYLSCKTALEKTNLTPLAFTQGSRYMSDSFPKENNNSQTVGTKFDNLNSSPGSFNVPKNVYNSSQIKQAMIFNERVSGGFGAPKNDSLNISQNDAEIKVQALTQVFDSYIIAKDEKGLVLIDQHAAHERVRYEMLLDQLESKQKQIQKLLLPLSMELTIEESNALNSNREIFENLGFEIEPFGNNTFVIYSVCSFLAKDNVENIIKEVLDDIMEGQIKNDLRGNTETIINYMACRSAIKFGQKLNISEIQALISQMQKLKRPYTCPHGRPTMISLTINELERLFGRK